MEKEEQEVGFIDAEARSGGKEKITFKEIVLSHLKKIGTFASVEFRGGWWDERTVHTSLGGVTKSEEIRTYIEDTREVYNNSINYLFDILYPHFDKKMKDEGEKIDKELDKTYNDNTVVVEEDREDETSKEGKEVEQKERRVFKGKNNKSSYRAKKLEIKRKLFRALCSFLKRIDYFKGKDVDEVM